MILNHSAGLPALRTEVEEGGFLDWDYMVELLENEEPFWIPGEKDWLSHDYHWLVNWRTYQKSFWKISRSVF